MSEGSGDKVVNRQQRHPRFFAFFFLERILQPPLQVVFVRSINSSWILNLPKMLYHLSRVTLILLTINALYCWRSRPFTNRSALSIWTLFALHLAACVHAGLDKRRSRGPCPYQSGTNHLEVQTVKVSETLTIFTISYS